jgi:hypothetical protein
MRRKMADVKRLVLIVPRGLTGWQGWGGMELVFLSGSNARRRACG